MGGVWVTLMWQVRKPWDRAAERAESEQEDSEGPSGRWLGLFARCNARRLFLSVILRGSSARQARAALMRLQWQGHPGRRKTPFWCVTRRFLPKIKTQKPTREQKLVRDKTSKSEVVARM